jgi:hypothetical protein
VTGRTPLDHGQQPDLLTGQVTPGGTPGALFVQAVTVGTVVQITSTSSTDTSVVSYLLVEPA